MCVCVCGGGGGGGVEGSDRVCDFFYKESKSKKKKQELSSDSIARLERRLFKVKKSF